MYMFSGASRLYYKGAYEFASGFFQRQINSEVVGLSKMSFYLN